MTSMPRRTSLDVPSEISSRIPFAPSQLLWLSAAAACMLRPWSLHADCLPAILHIHLEFRSVSSWVQSATCLILCTLVVTMPGVAWCMWAHVLEWMCAVLGFHGEVPGPFLRVAESLKDSRGSDIAKAVSTRILHACVAVGLCKALSLVGLAMMCGLHNVEWPTPKGGHWA